MFIYTHVLPGSFRKVSVNDYTGGMFRTKEPLTRKSVRVVRKPRLRANPGELSFQHNRSYSSPSAHCKDHLPSTALFLSELASCLDFEEFPPTWSFSH